MNLRRKQKRVISLMVTSAMLFSNVGMAAAGPIEGDSQPAITMDAESDPTLVVTLEENKAETESETGSETESEAEGETEEGTEEKTEEETREESEEGTEEDTEGETEEETEAGTEEETEEGTEEGTEEETEEETEAGTEEETEEGTKEETEGETEEGAEEETKEDDLLEDSDVKDESSAVPENPDTKPPIDPTPNIHEHNWSVDWSYDGIYHWHECGAEDCPVADDSEKDGYAEHSYDDYDICTGCGYNAMDGIAAVAQVDIPTYQKAYDTMIALQEKYPEGMTWTNFEPYGSNGKLGSAYTWNGGAIYGARSAVGCMAFAFLLSDAVFDHLPARPIENGDFTFEDVKVGDILRVQGNSHSVIVLQKSAGGVTVAEANYKKTVHWGRAMSVADVEDADFIITRYPEDYNIPADDPEADKVIEKGTAGELDWSLTNGKVLTISGSGEIPNYSQGSSPWSKYDFYTVVIEEGVTGIGDYAFYQSKALSVYIPDSVEVIGKNAFSKSALVAVTIPGTVKTIGNSAFDECVNLTSATVSEGVETIGDKAFRGCKSLAYIDFPASITSVGTSAFESCTDMVSVRFMPGSGKVTLGDGLFRRCQKLTILTLPQMADRISDGMFQSCNSLTELYIPASVQSISEFAFTECYSLGVIYFGGSEAEWKAMLTKTLEAILKNKKIVCNAVFDDPFADDPDDPGDFQPGEDKPCTNHVDADKDGICDNCGELLSIDNPGTDDGDEMTDPDDDDGDDTTDQDDGDDKTDPDDDDKNPPGSGDNDNSTTDSSDDSDDSSDSSDESGDFNESDNSTISTVVSWEADGSRIVTQTQRDGTVVTTTTNPAGKVETKAQLSSLAIDTAEKNGRAVALPISPVQVTRGASTAPEITVYTEKDRPVKVAIPAFWPTAGTVVVIVNEDGSTSVIKDSVPTGNSVEAFLPNGATVKVVDNSKSFSDVPPGAWFENAVSFISARDLFYGTTETAFAPAAPMTYAVAVTALARFDGAQTDGGITWYEKSMEWAVVRGMRDGAGADSNVTCEQLVTMLWKYQGSPAATGPVSDSGAAGQISDTQKAMDWAMKNGLSNGFGEGTLNSQGQVSRAQAAQIIMNLAKKTMVDSAH